jgi:tRNA A-37 threonylcarbamoyl transferase component Bud32
MYGVETVKSQLTDMERSKIITLAESLVEKEEIYSLCAYGSRVAGYAREDSDYDIIIVANNVKKTVTEKDKKDPTKSQPLIIEDSALMKDAKQPSGGEFVIGRFLNIYEPIVNAEFLHSVEVEYKKRIIAEELLEIQTDYGDFSSNLVIPYEYFLFDKLHKRALSYPEAMFSYARTYACDQREENIEFTLRGFRVAAESLASNGIIENTGDSVRIFRGKKRTDALTNLYKMFPLERRGGIRYAYHGFANRIGYGFKTKPLAKLKMMGKVKSMIELDRPKKLLRLEEGVIFDDTTMSVEELAQIAGFGDTYEYKEKKMGDFINSTQLLEIWDDENQIKYVLKHFPELKSAKWALLNLWSIAAKRFNQSPLSRLNREVEALRRLRELKIPTHHIIGVILDDRTLVSEFLDGVPLSKFVEDIIKGKSTDTSNIEKYGKILGKIHKAGLVYGDTKPQNAFVFKDRIDLIDLEQAVERGDKAWDLAEFLYFSATHLEEEKAEKKDDKTKEGVNKEEGMRLVAEAFLTGYRSESSEEVVAKAKSVRYLIPFLPMLPGKMRSVVRNTLTKYSRNDVVSP